MTGMTGLAPTSSSFYYQWTYDVFINFRGEDTCRDFTGHLYNALNKVRIRTFFDDEEKRSEDEITPTPLKAIENSRMAISVFSKNYAYSTFCLDELVKIHECIKKKGRLVLPIFYGVEPSEVRHQKGNYEKALSMHMKKLRADKDKIQSWKLALYEVANIAGYNPGQNGYEYQLIERIVKDISSIINQVPLHVAKYPVGFESRVLTISSLLQIGSTDKVIMVGICGSGGMGKTTIARALYNSIANNFEGLCFLPDVKEKSRKYGLDQIQETILSELVGVDIKIQDANEGVEVIKKRLKQKKILLFLDNVDSLEQLKKLAGDCNWFSGGSRIIITTRDNHLLVRHGVESIYNMEAFSYIESLEFLSWNAFRNKQVDPSYMDVLNRTVVYAQGLPLALEVIGSNLRERTMDEWESMLDAYKRIPNEKIQQVLKVSYEGLEQIEKEIFLDIACFFNGGKLEHVKYMVEVVHGYNNLSYSIRVLEDKCLIKKNYDRIEMHDLIRDMGREIVLEESPNNPGKRSRLWFHRDIVDVLKDNTGTHEVRMIIQDNLSKCMEVNWDGEAFKSMKMLQILIFENVKFSENPKYLPNSLKVLIWKGYPSSCWPPNFCPKKLVILDIGHSYLSSLEIIKTSDNLCILNLRGCEYVTAIPDLSNLTNLEKLNLKGCKNLIEIHDSIGYLPKLRILYAEASISFWFCNRFPRALCLCVLLKPTGAPLSLWVGDNASDVDHLVAYNLSVCHTKEDEIERVFQKKKWNHVRSYVRSDRDEAPVVIEESGMYVNKRLSDTKDISFTNPYQTLDCATADQEQLGTRMKEKEVTLQKKRALMGDYNFASSSTAFRYTKRGTNSSIINLDDNDVITPQIPFVSASDIINNQEQEERVKVQEKGILEQDMSISQQEKIIQGPKRRIKIHYYILEVGVFVGILSLLVLFIYNTTSYT